jgi:hypothetical protein
MASSDVKIAAVADVSVGYGSPQIPRMMESLAAHYGQEAVILEPDQTDKRPLDVPPQGCTLERIATTVHPHTALGRREYIAASGRRINALRPDLLVLFCTFTLPVLTQLRYRPRYTLYHSIESVSPYGEVDVAVNRRFASDVDLVVFPEENRARIDGQRCGLSKLPMAVVYNASNDRSFQAAPVSERMPKLLYTGTLDLDHTLADYFLRPELGDVAIDIFGNTSGRDKEALKARLACLSGPVRYRGFVSAAALKQMRGRYAYSIIMWAPANENQYYAAPNKFFDAIADGVPPIVAPHPQCKLMVDRYECGILMENWSFEAFRDAVEQAMLVFGTPEYDRMVEGCRRAVECEVNWPAQFQKVRRLIPSSLDSTRC